MKATAATTTAQKVLIEVPEAPEEQPVEAPAAPAAEWVLDDGLPPPTHAQVAYWRQHCGELTLAKGRGVANDAWTEDLSPTRSTLRALVERGLIVRRK